MGQLKIVKLHFRSALHLGTDIPGIGVEDSLSIAHSDTIFSCLINAYAELHSGDPKAVKRLLSPFHDGEPPFRISSAFPFQMQTESTATYYLPKPLVDPPLFYNSEERQWATQEYGKLVRETQLVPMDMFQNWLIGEETDMEDLRTQNISSLCMPRIHPQHARDRLTDATAIYHTGLIHFHGGSGLYFLIELNNKSLLGRDEFRDVLKQAGINGLGGRRSHGNGVFEVTDETINDLDDNWENLFNLGAQDGFINLSLYLPEPNAIANLDPVAYQLVPRKGWCYSSVDPLQRKRQTVTMFGEGSVFRTEPTGTLTDVTPQKPDQSPEFTTHKIYRYGIPIKLPIKILE